jgi:hypothetical protein
MFKHASSRYKFRENCFCCSTRSQFGFDLFLLMFGSGSARDFPLHFFWDEFKHKFFPYLCPSDLPFDTDEKDEFGRISKYNRPRLWIPVISRDHLHDCQRCSMANVDEDHDCDKISLEVFMEHIASIVQISVRLVVESEESSAQEDTFVFNDDTYEGLLHDKSEYGLRVFKKKNESVCIIAQKKFNVKSVEPPGISDITQKLLRCIFCLKVARKDQRECEEIFVQVQPFSKDSFSGAMDPSKTFAYKQGEERLKLSSGETDSFFPVDMPIMKHLRSNNFCVDSALFANFLEYVHDFQKAEALHFSNGMENFLEFFFKHDGSSAFPIPTLYQLQHNIDQLRHKQDCLRTEIYSYGVSEWFEHCFKNAIRRKIIFDAAETKVERFVMPNGHPLFSCRLERPDTKEHCLLARFERDEALLQNDDFVSFEHLNKRYYFRVKNRSAKSDTEVDFTVLLEHVELNADVPLESVKCIQLPSVQFVRHPILHFMVKFKKDNAFMGKNPRKFKNNAFLKKILEWEISDSKSFRPSEKGYSITCFTDTELAITALFLTATGEGTDKSFDGVAFPSSFRTLRKFPFQKLDMG